MCVFVCVRGGGGMSARALVRVCVGASAREYANEYEPFMMSECLVNVLVHIFEYVYSCACFLDVLAVYVYLRT